MGYFANKQKGLTTTSNVTVLSKDTTQSIVIKELVKDNAHQLPQQIFAQFLKKIK